MKANKVPDLDSMSTHGAAALRKSEPDALGQKHSILSGCSISFEISFEMLPFNDLWGMAVSQLGHFLAFVDKVLGAAHNPAPTQTF
jgi:hypothetical protein